MTDLWNPAAAWDALTPEQQRRIGVAAILFDRSAERNAVMENWERAWDAAESAASAALSEAVDEAIPTDVTDPPRPDLSAIGVRACHACGCTDDCACPEGCEWVGPNLCSSCAPSEAA